MDAIYWVSQGFNRNEVADKSGVHRNSVKTYIKMYNKARVFIKAAAGRNRINVLGALNAITLKIETVVNTDCVNAQTIVELLRKLAVSYHRRYENLNHSAISNFCTKPIRSASSLQGKRQPRC
jgi:transposase